MANRRNAVKKIRVDIKKRFVNRIVKSELKTLARKFASFCSEKKWQDAQALGRTLFSKIDKAVKKGLLKENTANRRKSRIARRLTVAQA